MNKNGFLFMVIHAKHVSFTFVNGTKTATGSNPCDGTPNGIVEQTQHFLNLFQPKSYQIRTN